jgi:hypothetical protein
MTWLLATPQQIDAINALLPAGVLVCGTADVTGKLWLGSDLLTDIASSRIYCNAREILLSLPMGDPVFPVPASPI